MMALEGKNILFLSVSFFSYENAIAERLRQWGAHVDFFDERPSNTVLSKGIIRIYPEIYRFITDTYYRRILKTTSGSQYDFLLLIKGEAVPHFFLQEIRRKNPGIKMIYYTFDPIDEYPKTRNLLKFFDLCFTFERADAEKYKISFRPLFFLEEYRKKENVSATETREWDICFIGSAHTDRYTVGEEIRRKADRIGLRSFYFYYAPGKIAFYLRRFFDPNMQRFNLKKVSFHKLRHSEIIDKYSKSVAVLDINKPFQDGLTMRTFETLAMGRKLMTTNPDIRNYPFYNPENILIISRDHIDLRPDFFTSGFQKIPEKVLEKMTLDSWIECLFIRNQDEYWKSSSRIS